MATIIDGRHIAKGLRQEIQAEISQLKAAGCRLPGLAVVLVGDDPASHIYVGHKERACREVGIRSSTYRLPANTPQDELLNCIRRLNADPAIDGILVQLPLPRGLDRQKVIHEVSPLKDVDGLGPQNQGLLALGLRGFVPCTPLGVMALLQASGVSIAGAHAVVIGRSQLVGAPMVRLLLQANASVTNLHSQSVRPAELCRQADIVVVAAGVPGLVGPEWIKPGAVVIDVGMHRQGERLVGDVRFAEVEPRAGAITPVPGGVGPMTIACLLRNCLQAYRWQAEAYRTYGC